MKIYICTSTRNLDTYLSLRETLILSSFVVPDWTLLLPPDGQEGENRNPHDHAGTIFSFCRGACASADMVVYIGPSGMNAACELGIAFASGVTVWGVAGENETPSLMVRGCVSRWFPSTGMLISELTRRREW